jgi:protein-S-isoprenylcysteine O-methyltransferase Ste14
MDWGRIAKRIRVPLGFVFAVVYMWLAKPTWSSIGLGGAIAAFGVWIRAMASGHVKKNEELTTTGLYAFSRNPLYLGSIVIALGFAVASLSVWVAAIIIGLFVAIYVPVIRGEEIFLRSKFANYDDYARRVPRLVPSFTTKRNPGAGFSSKLYMQHREYNAIIGTVAVLLALVAKILWMSNN